MFASDEACRFVIKRLKHPSAGRSYLSPRFTDAAEWARETRGWARQRLFYEPAKVPLEPEVVEEEDFGPYVRKRLYFRSAEDCKVSAYLLVPKGLTRPAPAVVALHDHSGKFYWGKEKVVDHKDTHPYLEHFQDLRYGGRGYASALAARGYVVAVIDALGWGERGWLRETWLQNGAAALNGLKKGSEEYIIAYDQLWAKNHYKLEETILYAGATYMGISVWDDSRTVDLLRELPEVDGERIGCVGLSMGSYRSAWLAAMDERIKCSCQVCWTTRIADKFPHRGTPLFAAVPGLYDELPYPDLVSLAVPRNLLILYGENDELFDMSSIEKACETVSCVYQKAGSDACFESRGYPVGHQFSREMQDHAFAWMDAILDP